MIASYARPSLVLDIAARKKGYELNVAAATDFETTLRANAGPVQMDGLLPYCFDAAGERVLYTHVPDMARALSAPFLYQAQYLGADHLVSVPLEQLREREPSAGMSPSFVLSPSRCGSTLLSMLLHHARQPVASEPDVYTQVATMPRADAARIGHAGRLALIRGSTAALARQIGAGVVIKLRDHCNDIALLLAEAVPEARMAFMLRDRMGWANSRHRAFSDPPEALADILRRGVMTYDALAQAGRRPVLIWYEDLVANPRDTLVRLDVAAAALDTVTLRRLLAGDAQAGTGISQENTRGRGLSPEAAAQFDAAWANVAPRDVLQRHGMQRLLP